MACVRFRARCRPLLRFGKARLDLDVEDPVIVAVDPLGVDVRARFDILRLPFGTPIEDPDRVLDIVRNWARI